MHLLSARMRIPDRVHDALTFVMVALGLALIAAMVIAPTGAFAASVETAVQVSPIADLLREYLRVVIDAALVALLGWGLRYFHLSGNAKAEQASEIVREFLHTTVDRGIERAIKGVPGGIWPKPADGTILGEIIDYVEHQAPDAIRKLGASPEDLRRLVESRMATITTPKASEMMRPA